MSPLQEALVTNTCLAALLALLASLVTRHGRHPAWSHALWLLVLVKLVTPPFLRLPLIDVPASWTVDAAVEATSPRSAIALAELASGEAPESAPWIAVEATPVIEARHDTLPWEAAALALWCLGTLLLTGVAWRRAHRFQRGLANARSAPRPVRELAAGLARAFELRRIPPIDLVAAPISPMLWGVPPARILLPAALVETLPRERLEALLAHELAHFKRRDHWVRYVELVATTCLWWHPLVWLARRELREAEEQSCDAWVLRVLPRRGTVYAKALLDTIDFVSASRACLPPAASGAGHARHLKRRVTMILEGRTTSRLGLSSRLALAVLASAFLPLVPIRGQEPGTPATGAVLDTAPERQVPRATSTARTTVYGVTTRAVQDPATREAVPLLRELPVLDRLFAARATDAPPTATDDDLRAAVRSLKEANAKLGEAIRHLERRLNASGPRGPAVQYWRGATTDDGYTVIEVGPWDDAEKRGATRAPKRGTQTWVVPNEGSEGREAILWRRYETHAPGSHDRVEVRSLPPGTYRLRSSTGGTTDTLRVEAQDGVRIITEHPESRGTWRLESPGRVIVREGDTRLDAQGLDLTVPRATLRIEKAAPSPGKTKSKTDRRTETKDGAGAARTWVEVAPEAVLDGTTGRIIVASPPADSATGVVRTGRLVRTGVVRAGDSLATIAARELGDARRVDELRRLNPEVEPGTLRPGQVLLLPLAPAETKPEPETAKRYGLHRP